MDNKRHQKITSSLEEMNHLRAHFGCNTVEDLFIHIGRQAKISRSDSKKAYGAYRADALSGKPPTLELPDYMARAMTLFRKSDHAYHRRASDSAVIADELVEA